MHDGGWTSRLHPDATMTFTRRGVTLTSLPRADQRFAPTTPPPTGRPTRRDRTTDTSDGRTADGSGHTGHTTDGNQHIDGDPRLSADPAAVDPDPLPHVNLPF